MTSPPLDLSAALHDLGAALAESGRPAMVIGGIAVTARGVPRHTVDIDATVWGEGLDIEEFLSLLVRHNLVPRIPDVVAFARKSQVLLLRHGTSDVPLDVTLAWLPFEADALSRAEEIDLAGTLLPIASAEDLVVYKAVAWRERDRSDIAALVKLYGPKIDIEHVRRVLQDFLDVIGDPGRLAEFDRLVGR